MGAFDKIPDQKRAAAILQRAILADRVSHAWLFTGPSATDLQTLALAFATTLQCTDRAPSVADACMQCKSCRQAIDGNHPDIRVWSHEKPKTFSVQEVRSLVQDVSIRPFSSERKVYIVPDAHLMRQEAQNALLKTLEEPPEYVVIILLAHTADAMLETIRSRCQMVELAAKDMEYDPELRKAAEEILLGISSWDLTQIRAAIQTLEEFKTDAARILSLLPPGTGISCTLRHPWIRTDSFSRSSLTGSAPHPDACPLKAFSPCSTASGNPPCALTQM